MKFKWHQTVTSREHSLVMYLPAKRSKEGVQKEKEQATKNPKRNQFPKKRRQRYNETLLTMAFVQVNPRNECKILFRTTKANNTRADSSVLSAHLGVGLHDVPHWFDS